MNPQVNPEAFKQKILSKYPNGVTSDGKRYADLDATDLTQRIVTKFPDGVTSEGIKYKDYLTPAAPAPTVQDRTKAFLTGTGPSFPAAQGGDEDIRGNIARTIGNIPSSARDLAKAAIAPVNPFDTESPINIGSNIVKGAEAVKDIVKTNPGGLMGGLKAIGSSLAGAPTRIMEGARTFLTGQKEKAMADPAQYASDIVKKGIEDPLLVPSLLYAPSKVRGTGVTEDAISGLTRPVTRGADTSLPAIGGKIEGVIETATNLTKRSEKVIDSEVVSRFEKGVKPNLGSRSTPTAVSKYNEDVVKAVSAINRNKPNLTFTDDAGEAILGRNPESLQQLSDALEQTKKSIFTQYDALANQAGDAGVKVQMAPIANELDSVINNKALGITNPRAVQYAKATKDRLMKVGDLDAVTAQEVIQNYNKSLEAFYRNPTYDTASQAAIDAMLVNRVRQALDEGVSGLTGVQYQALKNDYAALKTIERDVIKAALRDARKNVKGLIDFTDIFSGGQIVNGILSLNPATIGAGFAQKALAEFYKYLNNPNRAIRKMFEAIEEKPIAPPTLPTPTGPTSIKIPTPKPKVALAKPKQKPKVAPIKRRTPLQGKKKAK